MPKAFGYEEQTWLVKRVLILALALCSHPLPFDLHAYGFVVPHRAMPVAYDLFLSVQVCVFGWVVFYVDTLPGMRQIFRFARARRLEVSEKRGRGSSCCRQ